MTTIPYHHDAVDFAAIMDRFPPAPSYFDEGFRRSRDESEALQLARLRQELQRAAGIPFYQRLWSRSGFEPGDLSELGDLATVPSYTIEDIRESIELHPPLGDYQGVDWPADAAHTPARIFFSGGTTGRPRPTLYTAWDREVGAVMCARTYWLQGLRPGDVVLNTFSYSLHNAGDAFDRALYHWLGCLPISCSTGNVTPAERVIELARDHGAASILATGDHLVHLADVARRNGLDPARDFSFRTFPTVGSTDAVEEAWGVPAYDCYGFHEVQYIAAECEARTGLHIWDDAFIVEVADPDTGAPQPDGEVGDLVVTCLYKTGSPQIRFNAKDLSVLQPDDGACACGGTSRRMGRYLGRSDTMVKLRGINVWPEACGSVVAEDPRVLGEYFVTAERREGRDAMTCHVEVADGVDRATVKEDLERQLKLRLGVRIEVDPVASDALAPLTGRATQSKPRRFEDRRALTTRGTR